MKENAWFPSCNDMNAQDEAFKKFKEEYKNNTMLQKMTASEYEQYLFYYGFFRGCEHKDVSA